ncbi:hypothetical protein ACE38W_00990 [Chitinophaga sp. Hz27]|uniref:hypothetical protein n=1 Tax=Chitinophaga sp. Hz27 TaxID=3347169 RepID=UPI0035DB740E
MFTIENYFKAVKDIPVSDLPVNLKEAYDFVKEVTENYTTWSYYHSDKDIRAAVDKYLHNISVFMKPKKSAKQKVVAPKLIPVSEAVALDAAKKLISAYVLKGDSLISLNKSHLGVANGNYDAHINNNKIHIDAIKGEKVSFVFPLEKVYNEILSENGGVKSSSKNKSGRKVKTVKTRKVAPAPQKPIPVSVQDVKPVERVVEELRFIKRYVLLHGKTKTDSQILNFINALQRAIIEKRIRKTSAYAEYINYIQSNLVRVYNKMKTTVSIEINASKLSELMKIAGSEKVRLSVAYMKRYVGIQGKHITKEKATKLYNLIAGAIKDQKITPNDPYITRMKRLLESLRTFIKTAGKSDTVQIHHALLNGIQGALNGCSCGCGNKKKRHDGLNGVGQDSDLGDALPPETVLSSMDFVKMKFDTLGFTGKWRDLIGDPSRNFSVMIFGKPKMGKSYLSVDFAAYLARNHGKVLYVAKEEGLDYTLQEKLNSEGIKHPNLYVTGELPSNLDNFDFIFLDSVNRLGLTSDDLRQLKGKYPSKSFIFVFQSTKQGNFRGENAFQHDVDSVIEVPEKGRAVQMGRFNQGGEMEIFERLF